LEFDFSSNDFSLNVVGSFTEQEAKKSAE